MSDRAVAEGLNGRADSIGRSAEGQGLADDDDRPPCGAVQQRMARGRAAVDGQDLRGNAALQLREQGIGLRPVRRSIERQPHHVSLL